MSKFCTTCGAQLDDNATFCTSCGATQGEQPKQESAAASAADTVKNTFSDIKDKVDVGAIKDSLTIDNIKSLKSNPNKNTIIALSCIGVVALIVIIIILCAIFSGGYKKPIDNLFNAMEDGDGKSLMKIYPDVLLECDDFEDKIKDMDYDDAEEYFDEIADQLNDVAEEDYGKDIKISYKVTDKDELSSKKLKDIKDSLKEQGAKNVKVTAGYEVDMEVKIKGDDDEDEDDMTIVVAKVNGQWCIPGGAYSLSAD